MNRKLLHLINFLCCMLDTWLFIAPFIAFYVINSNNVISYPFTTPEQTALFGFVVFVLLEIFIHHLIFSVYRLVDFFRKDEYDDNF